MERVKGIEPSYSAWEAEFSNANYPCIYAVSQAFYFCVLIAFLIIYLFINPAAISTVSSFSWV